MSIELASLDRCCLWIQIERRSCDWGQECRHDEEREQWSRWICTALHLTASSENSQVREELLKIADLDEKSCSISKENDLRSFSLLIEHDFSSRSPFQPPEISKRMKICDKMSDLDKKSATLGSFLCRLNRIFYQDLLHYHFSTSRCSIAAWFYIGKTYILVQFLNVAYNNQKSEQSTGICSLYNRPAVCIRYNLSFPLHSILILLGSQTITIIYNTTNNSKSSSRTANTYSHATRTFLYVTHDSRPPEAGASDMSVVDLLRSNDMFSLGCIIAELYLEKPLFSQRSLVAYKEHKQFPTTLYEVQRDRKTKGFKRKFVWKISFFKQISFWKPFVFLSFLTEH